MPIPQVVLDTNVIVAGLRSRRGSAFQLLMLVGMGRFDIHLSVPLVLEYQEVLSRELSVERNRSVVMSRLNVQLPDSLYKNLQVLAEQDGISVDQFIATAVAEKIAALTTETYLEEMAKRGTRNKYEAVLAKVPDIEPEPYDRLPTD